MPKQIANCTSCNRTFETKDLVDCSYHSCDWLVCRSCASHHGGLCDEHYYKNIDCEFD